MREMVFDYIPLETSHTAFQVARRVHYRSSPSQMLYTGITDNASNVRKACDRVINRLPAILEGRGVTEDTEDDEEHDDTAEPERAIACVAHTVNLAVGDSIGDATIKARIDKMSTVIAGVSRSNQRRLALSEIQRGRGVKAGKELQLVSYVSTRWNSLSKAIARFIALYDPLVIMFAKGCFANSYEDKTILPDRSEAKDLADILEVLNPLESFTVLIQGASYMTAPHVQHWIIDVIARIEASCMGSEVSKAAVVVERKLLDSLWKRTAPYFQPEHPFTLAALLHPWRSSPTLERLVERGDGEVKTTKWLLVDWLHILMFDEDEVLSRERLTKCRKSKALSKFLRDESSGSDSGSDKETDTAVMLAEAKSKDQLSRRKQVNTLISALNDVPLPLQLDGSDFSVQEADEACRKFFSERPIHEQLLAQLVFSTVATSASSERVFSASGLIDTALRNRMSAAMLEKLTVIQCFLKRVGRQDVDRLLDLIDRVLRHPEDSRNMFRLAYEAIYEK
jgi:hypothetical protein